LKLITQDKNKYNSHKYRLVVRVSNRYILCQIIYSEIVGDKVLCSAHSKELPKYGLPVGLKNYSASYCTGLLLARRLLKQLGLDEVYSGVEDVEGTPISTKHNGKTYYVEEVDDEKKPFRALLDVGTKNTTTGAKIFGAMKGASDGGLDIPHSEKRFPGYSRDTKSLDAEIHKGRIMGEHIADYMRELEEDDEEMYAKHFAGYVENGIDADELESVLEKVHEAIRADPTRAAVEKFTAIDKSFRNPRKSTLAERRARSDAKKATLKAANDGDEEEEGGDDEEENPEEDD
jgi:large subunit ribosomal protein L5e